jgi:site-specific recombinase XerD
MPELAELIQRWQDKLELAGKAPRTRESYRAQIERLATWAAPRPADGLQLDDLERFILERKRAGIAEATLGVAVCAFKSFYRQIGSPAADGLKFPTVKDRAQRTLRESEVEAVLACIDTSTAKGKRDLAIIGLLVATGLRAAEIARLRLQDIDLERQVFCVIVKGGKTQEKWFDEYAASLIVGWLSVRPSVARPYVDTLFVGMRGTKTGQPLTREGVKILCRELAGRAGVDHFSPHALRRSFATLATENGCPTRLLQEAGGWADLRMVEKYTKAIRLKTFEKFSPLIGLMRK